MALDRKQIVDVEDAELKTVPVPEWGKGAEVCIRTLDGKERDEYEHLCVTATDSRDFRGLKVRLVAAALCDETGKRLFDPASEPHRTALNRKCSAALDRIFEAAQALNRLRDEDIEELAKNSAGGQSAASGSD